MTRTTNTNKSPFFVVKEFISPLMCEELIDMCEFTIPNADKEEHELKTIRTCESAESVIYERLLQLVPTLQTYYGFDYKGTERVIFEWFPPESQNEFQCENSSFLRGKWLRTKQRDFTGILFLTDYQEKTPFENTFEAYGGKLEFVQHQFSFQPQRGTLVMFPSDPHFINITSKVFAGDLFQARIQIAAQTPYLYQPQQFEGNYATWFKEELTA
jgi:hypothetical protein